MKRLAAVVLFILLTLLTQVGGLVFLLTWLIGLAYPQAFKGGGRAVAGVALFAVLYAGISQFVVPPLAALGGRVPLPCRADADRPFAAASPIYCAFNRHYVTSDMVALLTQLSRDVSRAYPGTITLYLDANLPLVNGFPLLPHLSHNDGRKLDIAYYYADPAGAYLPATLRSPIGYWAFEQPGPGDPSPCREQSGLSLRWDFAALQDKFPVRPLEPDRTRAALQWLVGEGGARFKVERVFIEPYLAARLGVSSGVLGFQGCRAARHDDHMHVQIRP
jgi:hypothetical protein